jgi:DNA-directed RNA polymerase II subunit RPB1
MRVGQGSWSFVIETAAGREPVAVQRIYATLDAIPDEDSLAAGFDPAFTHRCRLMFTALPVLPPHVRRAVSLNPSVVNQDDLTSTLSVIIKRNALLRKQLQDGTAPLVWRASEQMLAHGVHCWIDGTDLPVPVTGFVRGCSTGKSIKSIRRRIEGKQGLVRQNLLGKRTDFTARTVITGDPYISIREVGVPLSIANNLKFPKRVTPRNAAELTRLAAVELPKSEIYAPHRASRFTSGCSRPILKRRPLAWTAVPGIRGTWRTEPSSDVAATWMHPQR